MRLDIEQMKTQLTQLEAAAAQKSDHWRSNSPKREKGRKDRRSSSSSSGGHQEQDFRAIDTADEDSDAARTAFWKKVVDDAAAKALKGLSVRPKSSKSSKGSSHKTRSK